MSRSKRKALALPIILIALAAIAAWRVWPSDGDSTQTIDMGGDDTHASVDDESTGIPHDSKGPQEAAPIRAGASSDASANVDQSSVGNDTSADSPSAHVDEWVRPKRINLRITLSASADIKLDSASVKLVHRDESETQANHRGDGIFTGLTIELVEGTTLRNVNEELVYNAFGYEEERVFLPSAMVLDPDGDGEAEYAVQLTRPQASLLVPPLATTQDPIWWCSGVYRIDGNAGPVDVPRKVSQGNGESRVRSDGWVIVPLVGLAGYEGARQVTVFTRPAGRLLKSVVSVHAGDRITVKWDSPLTTLSGTITAEKGLPLGEATVRFIHPSVPWQLSTTTDQFGRYLFTQPISRDEYAIEASAPGFLPKVQRVDLRVYSDVQIELKVNPHADDKRTYRGDPPSKNFTTWLRLTYPSRVRRDTLVTIEAIYPDGTRITKLVRADRDALDSNSAHAVESPVLVPGSLVRAYFLGKNGHSSAFAQLTESEAIPLLDLNIEARKLKLEFLDAESGKETPQPSEITIQRESSKHTWKLNVSQDEDASPPSATDVLSLLEEGKYIVTFASNGYVSSPIQFEAGSDKGLEVEMKESCLVRVRIAKDFVYRLAMLRVSATKGSDNEDLPVALDQRSIENFDRADYLCRVPASGRVRITLYFTDNTTMTADAELSGEAENLVWFVHG